MKINNKQGKKVVVQATFFNYDLFICIFAILASKHTH